MEQRPRGVYILEGFAFDLIYGPGQREAIAGLVDIEDRALSYQEAAGMRSGLEDIEVIFSGWGMGALDEAFLQKMPSLKAFFYGAGSVKEVVTEAFWQREVIICSAWAANAVPVVEFTFSQILFSLKCGWHMAMDVRERQSWEGRFEPPGAYESTAGLIGLGMIGRGVAERLKQTEIKVLAYDPCITAGEAEALNVDLVGLEDLFRRAAVVSLHVPWLASTEGMIRGEHLRLMPKNGTFINTARGAVVREDELAAALRDRADLFAVLDVTHPEPPKRGSPLYELRNVIMTPHIAGSMGRECRRMGQTMVEELQRYRAGEPLRWALDQGQVQNMA